MKIPSDLDGDERLILLEHIGRVRAWQGSGAGVFVMMLTPEQKREAARLRKARQRHNGKQSLGRIVVADVEHDQVIRFVLREGLLTRPRGRSLTFDEAAAAVEVWLRQLFTGASRVTIRKLHCDPSGDALLETAARPEGDPKC